MKDKYIKDQIEEVYHKIEEHHGYDDGKAIQNILEILEDIEKELK